MARDQEEISISQAGRRRGSGRDTPFLSNIISFLSMEGLRSYYQIPNNIDLSYEMVRANLLLVWITVQCILPGNNLQSGFTSQFHP